MTSEIKMAGDYAVINVTSDAMWYDENDINSWTERNVEELRSEANSRGVHFMCLKNTKDPSKCKTVYETCSDGPMENIFCEEDPEYALFI